jgi:hypothetical protein
MHVMTEVELLELLRHHEADRVGLTAAQTGDTTSGQQRPRVGSGGTDVDGQQRRNMRRWAQTRASINGRGYGGVSTTRAISHGPGVRIRSMLRAPGSGSECGTGERARAVPARTGNTPTAPWLCPG